MAPLPFGHGSVSSDSQIVNALERSTTQAADQRVAIAADEWVGNRPRAGGTIELDRIRFGHTAIIDPC
jgi:hypothetical protein